MKIIVNFQLMKKKQNIEVLRERKKTNSDPHAIKTI